MSKYNFIYAKEDQSLEPHENHIPLLNEILQQKYQKFHYYIVIGKTAKWDAFEDPLPD